MRRQSEHFADYRAALTRLEAIGVLYPCFCTRREIQAEIARAGGAPQGEAGRSIPAPASMLGADERAARACDWGADYALRLDVAGGARASPAPLDWSRRAGWAAPSAADPSALGDVGAGAQGGADQLSPRGHRRRRAAGGDTGHPRRRSVRRDAYPSPAAGVARPADPALSPSPAADRRDRPAARQTRPGADDPGDA